MHILNLTFKVLGLITSSDSVLPSVNNPKFNMMLLCYNYFITDEDDNGWIRAVSF